MNLPENSDAARAALADLRAKRRDLTATIDGAADRRRGYAVASEFGDVEAKAALKAIEGEVESAKAALSNVDLAIAELTTIAQDIERHAADRRAAVAAEQSSAAVDETLELDDQIDATADHLRALLEQRDELARNPALIAARRRGRGSMISERQIGQTLLSYFDQWLSWLPVNSPRYDQIERLADLDAREFGRCSAGMIKRGPRELTAAERALARSVHDVGLPIVGTNPRGWPDSPRNEVA